MIRSRVLCGALALAVLVPVAAGAQPPRNPFADLFGRAPERTGSEYTAVQFRSSAGAQVAQTLRPQPQNGNSVPDGLAAVGDVSLSGAYIRDRVQLSSEGRYGYQEYRREPAFGVPSYEAGFRADLKATTRLRLYGGGQFARSPFFQPMWLTPDQAGSMAPMDRAAVLLLTNDSVEGRAGITSNLTKRSTLDVSGQIRETRFAVSPDHNFRSTGGRAQWRRQIVRDLAVRAGYGRERLQQRTPEGDLQFTNELLDIGVDYSRSLSLARRTSLSFGTETSVLRENTGPRHFRLNGHVSVDKRFQRTWQVLVGARRSTDFVPGFRAPVQSDHANLGLNGYLAKRVILNIGVNGGRGQVGFNDTGTFVSYTGHGKVTMAVTRNIGVYTHYAYFHYQNPPDSLTLFALPRGARQAVSVGVQTWLSIFDKEKVIRDPR